MTDSPHRRPPVPAARLALLALAGLALLAGLDAALVRLGALAPVPSVPLGQIHGVLMVQGFLGTAICLERAVALAGRTAPRSDSRERRPLWPWLAPLASGVGTLLALLTLALPSLPRALAPLLGSNTTDTLPARLAPGVAWIVSLLLLTAIYAAVWRGRVKSWAVLVQLLGALAGVGGALVWTLGRPTGDAVLWWLMFLVLTIVGERLELARIALLTPGVEPRLFAWALGVLVALPLTSLRPQVGFPLLGLALAALVLDIGWHDVARRTVRLPGVARFAAVAMLLGYGWALVPALMWMVAPPVLAGHAWDIAVHSLTIGFTMSMVVAHAPVIIPAVVRRDVPHHPLVWLALALLHAGLLLRVIAGVREAEAAWRLGGTLGVSAFLVFVISTLVLTVRGARTAPRPTTAGAAPASSSTGEEEGR